jgi:chromatin structure-remodeling complex protein RSC7
MPHIPLYTQPTIANIAQLSPYPLLSSASHSMNKGTVKGIASLEYVFEPQYGYDYNGSGQDEMRERERVIREAEEWERQNREKIRPAS